MNSPAVAEPRTGAGPCPGRVLHVITRLDKGGSSDNTLLTCMGLADLGWEVTLAYGVTTDPSPRLADLERQGRVACVEIPNLIRSIRPLDDARAYRQLRRLIGDGGFDLIHTHSSKAGILGRRAARGMGCKVVHEPHGHVFGGYFNGAVTKAFVWLERRAARWCDRIVTLTDRGREDHLAFGVGVFEQFVTIPSGVPLEPFRSAGIGREAARASLGLPRDAFVVGCVARLVPVKGQVYLLEAASRLVEAIPSLHVLLVGGGEQREALESRAGSGALAGRVVFTGMVLDPRPALAAMDLFVLPSLNEGQGRAVIEAMASGIPVVASAVGGLPEVVDGGVAGVLVPPRDGDALARAIQRLASSPADAARIARAGRDRAERYSETAMITATSSLYSELLWGRASLASQFRGGTDEKY